MKGASAAIAVVVIAVIVVAGFLLYQNGLPFSPPTPRSYDNTVIHLTNKLISDVTPVANEKVNIMFLVANQGDKPLSKVTVNFFDIVGFCDASVSGCSADSGPKLLCQTGDSTDMVPATGRSCDLLNIQPGDARQVSLTIVAASAVSQGVVSYSIGYDYSGTRDVEIPVIDQSGNLPSGVQYIVNPATVGPVQISIEPPVGSQHTVNGNSVTENFARRGVPFTLKFSMSDVGNPEGTKEPLVIQPTLLTVTSTVFTIDQCDRMQSVSGNSKAGSTFWNQNSKLAVPDDTSITCVMEDDSTIPINSFDMGTVDISFNYHYGFENTENFAFRSV